MGSKLLPADIMVGLFSSGTIGRTISDCGSTIRDGQAVENLKLKWRAICITPFQQGYGLLSIRMSHPHL